MEVKIEPENLKLISELACNASAKWDPWLYHDALPHHTKTGLHFID